MTDSTKKILILAGKLLAIAVAGAALLLLGFLVSLFWDHSYALYLFPLFFVAAAALAIAWLVPGRKWKNGFFTSGIAIALAALAAITVIVDYDAYLDSIRVVDNSAIDTNAYLAFDPNADLARLDHPASLRFDKGDKLPALDGAAAFFPLYSAFVEATYPSDIPALNREDGPYQYHNTIQGYERLIHAWNCDILFALAPSDGQRTLAAECGVELEFIPIGNEAFVFFNNLKNPVDNLTVDEIRSIYAGNLTNWKEVGGESLKIQPYQRNPGSGSQTALLDFMGEVPLAEAPTELVNSMMTGIIEKVADYRNHRGALGFSFYHYAQDIVANRNIRLLSVNGVAPTPETIGNGTYPILNSFYMVVRKGERTEEMNRFIDWVLSDEGQALVAASGYAPIR